MSKRSLTSSTWVVSSIVPLILILLWEAAVQTGVWPSRLVAPPSQVAVASVQMVLTGELFVHVATSLFRLLVGFVVGGLGGILTGALLGASKRAEELFAPTLQALAPVPPPAWIPLLIIAFGIGEGSKIALITIGAFFVVFINTMQGVRSTDDRLVEVANAYQKSQWEMTWSVLLPSAIPSIMTGIRVALALSWILLIASEVIASSKGSGGLYGTLETSLDQTR